MARYLFVFALILTACSSSETEDPTPGQNMPPALTACMSNVDCQGGEVCREGECREACGVMDGCDDPFYRTCSTELGYCVNCFEDGHCAADEVCEANVCKPGCASDSDCQGGFSCQDRRCVSLDPIVCEAGSEACDGSEVVRCSVDGTLEERVDCGDGKICVLSEEEGPTCVELVCTPNDIGCIDSDAAFVCNSDGTERTPLPCREGQYCDEGVCRNHVCEPSSQSCVGNQRVVCSADGSAFTTESCSDGCASETGCTCTDGACEARVCVPANRQCVGNGVRVCNSSGSGWSTPEECPDTCVEGVCVEGTCTPGETLCSVDTLLTCNVLGTGYDVVDCTATDENCTEAGGTAECVGRVCVPDQVRCSQDGSAVLVCDARGSVEESFPCQSGEVCDRGVCVEEECIPDCSGRNCGPDPVCGESCGPCAGTCVQGQCMAATDQGLTITLDWTPDTSDLDLYVVKEMGNACDAETCNWKTCTNDMTRPDWDGSGTASDGDPSLSYASGSVSGPGPETVRLIQPQSVAYVVGAHHYQGSGNADVTLSFELDGASIGSVTRALAPGELWKGVVIDLGAGSPSPTMGSVEASFSGCDASASCGNDDECPPGQYCAQQLPNFPGTCANGCLSDSECGGLECNGAHDCVSTTAGWKQSCSATADCHVGFYCSLILQICQEYCDTVGSCAGDPDCCPNSGAAYCSQGALFPSCSDTP